MVSTGLGEAGIDPGGPPTDEVLVADARAGDAEALDLLLSRHQGAVYRFLATFLGDEEAAADVAQDALVRALENLEDFRGEAPFRSWLYAIARNEARGWLRRSGRRRETPLDSMPPAADQTARPDERAIRSAELERVGEALDRLPRKQRMSVSLRIFEGLSFREVARATDSTEGAARVNYHHGMRRLREWLHE